jgi:hypothetical protein
MGEFNSDSSGLLWCQVGDAVLSSPSGSERNLRDGLKGKIQSGKRSARPSPTTGSVRRDRNKFSFFAFLDVAIFRVPIPRKWEVVLQGIV